MTKKAEKAARIEENKRLAYIKKVRALIGYVGERMNVAAATAAYAAGKDALLCAAEIVVLEPVGAAVWPQKANAVEAATKHANERVAKNLAKLAAVGWDANVLAPCPRYVSKYGKSTTHEMYAAYEKASTEHKLAHCFVEVVSGDRHREASAEPVIVRRDEEKVIRFVTSCEEGTADQYNAFICKLVGKIGPNALSATLSGNHVWSYSILVVTMRDGTVQHWKTQQITNCSVLGNYFPQWPTRLLKGGAK